MPILLAAAAAMAFGASDFTAGLASRRMSPVIVTWLAQAAGLVVAVVAVVAVPGHGPDVRAVTWGAVSGVGAALGLLALFQGLAVGRFSVVATLSAVVVVVIPALVGVASGDRLSMTAVIGMAVAVPAIGLVSFQSGHSGERAGAGVGYGLAAGVGLSVLFIALDRAGTQAGAWPLVPSQTISLVVLAPFLRRGRATSPSSSRVAQGWALAGGLLAGAGNVLFLGATDGGQLAVVAVITAMYPAIAVVLARIFLDERWSKPQVAGLLAAAVAVVMVSGG